MQRMPPPRCALKAPETPWHCSLSSTAPLYQRLKKRAPDKVWKWKLRVGANKRKNKHKVEGQSTLTNWPKGGIFSMFKLQTSMNQKIQRVFHIFLETWWLSHYFCHLFPFSSPSPSVLLLPLHPTAHFLSYFLLLPSATSPQVVTTATLDPVTCVKAPLGLFYCSRCSLRYKLPIWTLHSTTKWNTTKNVWISQRWCGAGAQDSSNRDLEKRERKKKQLFTVYYLIYCDL